jgi:acyl-CoA synthetase (AMP-forming)/AMP-acid ligase II
MKQTDPLLDRWRGVLGAKASQPAIFDAKGEVVYTFGQIDQRAREIERQIGKFPVGSVLAVQIGNHQDWPSVLIACLRRGVVVVPLEQSISDNQRDAAFATSNVVAVAVPAGAEINIVSIKTSAATKDWGKNIPSLLKLTSGTTAMPRAIRFRSEQLLADCDQICETMGISDSDVNFGVIPVSHSYGFSNLLTPLIARGISMVLSRDRTPRAILTDLAQTGATVFPGMPILYQAFCNTETCRALPKLRLCISAGAPLPLAIARDFRAKFNLSIHSFYGASECGGICYDREAELEIDGYVGAAMNAVEVEMIDRAARSSQVSVRSAAVGDGYFPHDDKAKLAGGVFVPDDLLAPQGTGFRIVGRISDLINIAGKKVNPAEIEEVLLRFPGIREAIAFARSPAAGVLRTEEIAACVAGDAAIREKELLEFCGKQLSAWQVPRRIFILDSLPVNERGKISRREMAKQFQL